MNGNKRAILSMIRVDLGWKQTGVVVECAPSLCLLTVEGRFHMRLVEVAGAASS